MINTNKNVCYLIDAFYQRGGVDHKVKLLSRHSASSKEFKRFLDDYFTNVLPVSKDKRKSKNGIMTQQYTVNLEQWKDREIRSEVMRGITEKEKCY